MDNFRFVELYKSAFLWEDALSKGRFERCQRITFILTIRKKGNILLNKDNILPFCVQNT